MKNQYSVETLTYQQHVVTLEKNSLKIGADRVVAKTISGESLSFKKCNLLWVSKSKDLTRIAYNRLVSTSGFKGVRLPDPLEHEGFAKFKVGKDEVLLNKKLHKVKAK